MSDHNTTFDLSEDILEIIDNDTQTDAEKISEIWHICMTLRNLRESIEETKVKPKKKKG